MFAEARIAGGRSVAHSASCGFTRRSKASSRSERHDSEGSIIAAKSLCRPDGAPTLMVTPLPTACAVGYLYTVGFANWSTANSGKRATNRALYLRARSNNSLDASGVTVFLNLLD
jgi:hypothetical protein